MTATSIDGAPIQIRQFYLPWKTLNRPKYHLHLQRSLEITLPKIWSSETFKLSMIHGTAPLLSLQRSRVVPELFQLVPVVMSLDMPKVRMLIADDVGLGKTIEAGLIVSELSRGSEHTNSLSYVLPV